MGAAVLTAILAVLLSAASATARQLCLACHPVHYGERGSCTGCHRGNPATDRKNIAHQHLIAGRYARFTLGEAAVVSEGQRLLDQYACRRCHVIGNRGNRLAADLDQAIKRKAPEELAAAILKPVQNMPAFHLADSQVDTLVNALLQAAAGRKGAAPAAGPQVVHFDRGGETGQDLFSKKCGPCHRALTARLGALGRGEAGPNLSGLLSPWYPPTFRERQAWTQTSLSTWLKNPRTVRPWARMQPVVLTEPEVRELVDILRVEPDRESRTGAAAQGNGGQVPPRGRP